MVRAKGKIIGSGLQIIRWTLTQGFSTLENVLQVTVGGNIPHTELRAHIKGKPQFFHLET